MHFRFQLFKTFSFVTMACCLAATAQAGSLTITNPGFEAGAAGVVGATGWTISSGGTDFFTAPGVGESNIDPAAAGEGNQWLSGNRLVAGSGSSSNPQMIEQLIDISSDATLIDLGGASLSLDFSFADEDGLDNGTVNAYFYSDVAGTTAIGTDLTTGVLAPTGNNGSDVRALWVSRNLSGAVPVGARSVLLEIVNQRDGGSAGNTHFDDFSGAVVPEPASLALSLLGLMFITAGRRSKKM